MQIPVCALAGSTLSNQAWLEDFNLVTSALPNKISSDDVNTAIIGDATVTSINCEICNNGIDDDGDGLVDGNDPDCCSLFVSVGNDQSVCQGTTTTITATVSGTGVSTGGSCSGKSLILLLKNAITIFCLQLTDMFHQITTKRRKINNNNFHMFAHVIKALTCWGIQINAKKKYRSYIYVNM